MDKYINFANIDHYVHKKFVKSGGHGGQNVNKRNTKVQLHLNFADLKNHHVVSDEFLEKLQQKYSHGFIEVGSHATRYQHENLEIAKHHLHKIIREALESEVRNIFSR